jgi:hypothetical protein
MLVCIVYAVVFQRHFSGSSPGTDPENRRKMAPKAR